MFFPVSNFVGGWFAVFGLIFVGDVFVGSEGSWFIGKDSSVDASALVAELLDGSVIK